MLRNCLFIILSFSVLTSHSQVLRFSSDSISFPVTLETETDSIDVYIFNDGIASLNIDSIITGQFYGNSPISFSFLTSTISSDDSALLRLYFQPEHNILHNTELLFYTNQRDGHSVMDVQGQGTYSNTYYSSTQNLSEQALKNALNSRLANGYSSLSYNVARDNMYGTLDNNGGNVTCVYTGRVATFNDRPGANNNSFNCEHTFPQGFFSQNLPMRSDIHHLFPTDVSANSERGNNPFGVVTNPSWSVGGSKSGNGKFEPRDLHKGDCARAMLYFVIRYQDYTGFMASQESILRQWAGQFPPSTASIQRNNGIFNLQNNRNPLVDYPQFMERITSFTSNSVAVEQLNLSVSEENVDLGLVNAADTLTYYLHFVNYGNTAINLSNLSFDNGTGFFVEGGLPILVNVEPGDRYTIPIKFTSNSTFQTFNDVLRFQSNDPDFMNGSVQLSAETEDLAYLTGTFAQDYDLWPNPANSFLNISSSDSGPYSILIYNSHGQVIEAGTQGNKRYNVNNFPSGIYFVKITKVNGSWMGKFIKD